MSSQIISPTFPTVSCFEEATINTLFFESAHTTPSLTVYTVRFRKKKKYVGPRRLAIGLKNSIGSYSTTSITRRNNAYTHACSASTPGTHMHALTPLRSSTPSFPVYSAQFKNLTNQGRWRVVEYFL